MSPHVYARGCARLHVDGKEPASVSCTAAKDTRGRRDSCSHARAGVPVCKFIFAYSVTLNLNARHWVRITQTINGSGTRCML